MRSRPDAPYATRWRPIASASRPHPPAQPPRSSTFVRPLSTSSRIANSMQNALPVDSRARGHRTPRLSWLRRGRTSRVPALRCWFTVRCHIPHPHPRLHRRIPVRRPTARRIRHDPHPSPRQRTHQHIHAAAVFGILQGIDNKSSRVVLTPFHAKSTHDALAECCVAAQRVRCGGVGVLTARFVLPPSVRIARGETRTPNPGDSLCAFVPDDDL